MKNLSLLDAGFLWLERSHQPMHVGGLYLFNRPKDVPDDWLGVMREQVKEQSDEIMYPFNLKLKRRFGTYSWTEADDVDIDYHIRHTALPAPGRYRELFELVGRLHSTLLDRERPLWETQIIEGVERNQWALYTKVHHSVVDGMGGVRLIKKMFSEDPNEQSIYTPWTRPRTIQKVRPQIESDSAATVLKVLSANIQTQIGGVPSLIGALNKYYKILGSSDAASVRPYDAPFTVLNGKARVARRFVAQSYSILRIKRLAKLLNATVNDIVLAMCAGALRTWLCTWSELPNKPLTVMVPVALEPYSKNGQAGNNAVTMILASLATNIKDPLMRLTVIQESVRAGKSMLSSLTGEQLELFTSIAAAPNMIPSVIGLAGRIPPPFNLTISNVPGPKNPLYYNGSKLSGYYPVSIPLDGAVLNITAISYVDDLCFGITACRRSIPHAQKMIDYLEGALAELELGVGIKNG